MCECWHSLCPVVSTEDLRQTEMTCHDGTEVRSFLSGLSQTSPQLPGARGSLATIFSSPFSCPPMAHGGRQGTVVEQLPMSPPAQWAPPAPGPAQSHMPGFTCGIAWTRGHHSHTCLLLSCSLQARGTVTSMSF